MLAPPGDEVVKSAVPRVRWLDILAGLTERQAAAVLRHVNTCSYPRGELIVREGERGDSMFVAIEGHVEVVKRVGTDTSETITVLPEGSIFGEVTFIERGGKRSATVRANTDVRVAEFPGPAIREECRRDRDLAAKLFETLLKILVMRLRLTTDQLWDARSTERFRVLAERLKARIAKAEEKRGS